MKKPAIAASQSSSDNRHTGRSVGAVVTHLSGRANKKPEKPQRPDSDFDFSALESAIHELPSMDASKVVALHHRIVNGDYKVQSNHLAEKLIEFESSLDRS